MCHDRSLLERCFRDFVLPILEYCFAVGCSAADTHHKLPDRAVSGAQFLTGVGLSVTLLIVDLLQFFVCCIRPGVTRCIHLMMHYLDRMCSEGNTRCPGLTSVYLCATSLQNLAVPQDFCSLSVSLWNYLADPMFDGVRLAGFKSRANAFLLPTLLYPYYSLLLFFAFSSSGL